MSHLETVLRMEAEEKAFPNSTPSQIKVAKAILAEVARAKSLYTENFHSLHEGYGVIKEEHNFGKRSSASILSKKRFARRPFSARRCS